MHRNAEFPATDGRANEPYESGVNSTERSERESACTPAKCVSFRNEDLRPYPNVSTLTREVRAKHKQEMNIYQARIIEELTILARAGYRGVLTNKDGNVPDWFEILRCRLGFPIPPDDVEELACLHEIGALRHVVLLESHRKTKHALVIVEGETELTAFLEAYARGARAPWAFRIATPRMIVHAMKKDGALQAPCVAGALADCDEVIALFLFDGDKEGRKAVESLAKDPLSANDGETVRVR